MKLKKLETKKSALPREEYVFELVYDKVTPTRLNVKENVSSELKVKPEVVIISKINTEYGHRKALVHVNVYKDAETLAKIEEKIMVSKNTPKKEEASEE